MNIHFLIYTGNLAHNDDQNEIIIATVLLQDVIDHILRKEPKSIVIMKMDIENFECRAILGN